MAERRPPLFRQRDLSRAIKAAELAGKEVVRVEVDPSGKIVIITAREAKASQNELDEWMAAHADEA